MREIKFRIITKNNEVGFLKWSYIDLRYSLEDLEGDLGWFNEENSKPETLSEFTGLLDKNKKEIYEGDILQYNPIGSTNVIAERVEFYPLTGWSPMIRAFGDGEVIGNIYENPDLVSKT